MRLLKAVDLTAWADKPVAQFLRRDEAAGSRSPAASCTSRKIFFLDEPTTGLDPISAHGRVGEMLSRLKHERDLTIHRDHALHG